MGKYYDQHTEQLVTIFRRPKFRPQHKKTGTLPEDLTAPKYIEFLLPDATVLRAPTEREIILGRKARLDDPDVSIDLEPFGAREKGVSRAHAMIAVVRGKLTVRDLKSLNATLLNGQMLEPLVSYTLRDGDILTVGRMILRVRYL